MPQFFHPAVLETRWQKKHPEYTAHILEWCMAPAKIVLQDVMRLLALAASQAML
jgi:hypothetical protein